jgi:hypothetical protein
MTLLSPEKDLEQHEQKKQEQGFQLTERMLRFNNTKPLPQGFDLHSRSIPRSDYEVRSESDGMEEECIGISRPTQILLPGMPVWTRPSQT